MTRDEIDLALSRLRAVADRIGANLLELDRDPSRQLLEGATLRGETAARWADARLALASVWDWFTRFNALLEQAVTLRGTRPRLTPDRETELTALLTGPSIELARDDVPLAARELVGARVATTQCTPDELLTLMSEAFDEARVVVIGAATAWDAFVPRLQAARAALTQVSETTDDAPETAKNVERWEQRLSQLGDAIVMDPLSVSAPDIEAVEVAVAELRQRADAAVQFRVDATDRIATARAVVGNLRDAERDAVDAHLDAVVKIASASVPSPVAPRRSDHLASELDQISALIDEKHWHRANVALEDWTERATQALACATTCATANRAPIETRNELRGRLDAYRAKAHRLGLIEDDDLSELYEDARVVLYTAPTDLTDAEAAVGRYRRALPRAAEAGDEPR
jgi:hypothetical protein